MTAPLAISERLAAAAYRILNDGRRHAPEAVAWAERHLGHGVLLLELAKGHISVSIDRRDVEAQPHVVQRLIQQGFTLSEISLGAWAS